LNNGHGVSSPPLFTSKEHGKLFWIKGLANDEGADESVGYVRRCVVAVVGGN
jgi:hypothetical protein